MAHSLLTTEDFAELDKRCLAEMTRDDDAWECRWCGCGMLMRENTEPTPLCDSCAHDLLPQLIARVRELEAQVSEHVKATLLRAVDTAKRGVMTTFEAMAEVERGRGGEVAHRLLSERDAALAAVEEANELHVDAI